MWLSATKRPAEFYADDPLELATVFGCHSYLMKSTLEFQNTIVIDR